MKPLDVIPRPVVPPQIGGEGTPIDHVRVVPPGADPSPLLAAHLTDLGNVERLVALHGADLRYCDAVGWLAWNGCRWEPGAEHVARQRAGLTARATLAACALVNDTAQRESLGKYAFKMESAYGIRATVDLARSDPALRVEADALDADPWVLNVLNGTIDLKTGTLRPHRREDLLTKIVPVKSEPDAPALRWEKFLEEVQPDPAVRTFLHRFAGYALTGQTGEQVFPIFHGPGSNGKGVFTTTWRGILGDYAVTVPFSTFLVRKSDAATNDLCDLRGARLAVASEPDEGAKLAESVVKSITGEDPIKARRLYKEHIEFQPVCKIVLVGNHRPRTSGTDYALWRRILLVPWGVTIPAKDRDRDLKRKLKDELPGILAWAVRGCLDWQREGLAVPAAVRAATAGYQDAEDAFGRFLADACVVGPGLFVLAGALRKSYWSWCTQEGEEPLTGNKVAEALQDRGFRPSKGAKGARLWNGMSLRGEVAGVAEVRLPGGSLSCTPREGDFTETAATPPPAPPEEAEERAGIQGEADLPPEEDPADAGPPTLNNNNVEKHP